MPGALDGCIMAVADRPHVLFLAGPLLPPESVAVPSGIVAVWCAHIDELVEQAIHFQPRCVFLDRAIAGDASELALALRRVTYPDTIVALIGREIDTPAEIDVAIDLACDVGGEVARLVRFSLGQNVRHSERVRSPGRAVVEHGEEPPLEVDVVDISEDGIRLNGAAGLPAGTAVKITVTLGGRELAFEGKPVRRSEESVAYRFADVTPRARASLRAFLMRRLPPPPLQVISMKRTIDVLDQRELEDMTTPNTSKDLRDILDFCEREIVRRVLDRHGGNRTRTAKALGISRQALQQKLARFRAQATRHPNPAAPASDDEDVGSAAAG
jgi:hypothetical protein